MKKDKAQPKKATVLRTKVGTEYSASGYGRGVNKRNVYIINGYYYAYHPQYAEQAFTPCEGDLKGYVRVNRFSSGSFYEVNENEHTHVAVTPQPKEVKHTEGEAQIEKTYENGPYVDTNIKINEVIIGSGSGNTEELSKANAAELVKRWNLFPELVAELEKAKQDLKVRLAFEAAKYTSDDEEIKKHVITNDSVISMEALLKKAKGE